MSAQEMDSPFYEDYDPTTPPKGFPRNAQLESPRASQPIDLRIDRDDDAHNLLRKSHCVLTEQYQSVVEVNEDLLSEVDAVRQDVEALEQEKQALNDREEELVALKEKLVAQRELLRNDKDTLEAENDALSGNNNELSRQNDMLLNETEKLRKQRDAFEADIAAKEARNDALSAEALHLREEAGQLSQRNEALEEEAKKASTQIESLQMETVQLQDANSALAATAEELTAARQRLSDELQALEHQNEALDSHAGKLEMETVALRKETDESAALVQELLSESIGPVSDGLYAAQLELADVAERHTAEMDALQKELNTLRDEVSRGTLSRMSNEEGFVDLAGEQSTFEIRAMQARVDEQIEAKNAELERAQAACRGAVEVAYRARRVVEEKNRSLATELEGCQREAEALRLALEQTNAEAASLQQEFLQMKSERQDTPGIDALRDSLLAGHDEVKAIRKEMHEREQREHQECVSMASFEVGSRVAACLLPGGGGQRVFRVVCDPAKCDIPHFLAAQSLPPPGTPIKLGVATDIGLTQATAEYNPYNMPLGEIFVEVTLDHGAAPSAPPV